MDGRGPDTLRTGGELSDSEANARSRKVLEGYETELGGGSPSLTYDLPNGQKWKKKIWPRAYCPGQLDRWNSVEEILSYLISFDQLKDWITTTTPNLPPSGSIFFFNKKETKTYRNDGYQWKTRRSNANCIREDRMKLKLHGYKLLYACYTHSLLNENFHRRSYWLLQNPDLIMVHYLEHSGNNQETDCLQITEEERKVLAPANLDFLTISDRSLCSLLNMASSAGDTVALMKQLSFILHQNILKFRTIQEMVEASNAVLPFVKSSNIACKPLEQATPPTMADPSGVGVQATPIVRKPQPSTVAAVDVSTPSGLSLNPHILSQMLASNLLVFYQGDKSLNCIALNPAHYNPLSSSPATREDVAMASSAPLLPAQENSANQSDYDANKFTQFANALIQMNPLDTLQSSETNGKMKSGQATGVGTYMSPPLLNGYKERGTPRGKSPALNNGQSSTLSQEPSPLVDLASHSMDLHFDDGGVETQPPVSSTAGLTFHGPPFPAQGQSAWGKEPPFPWGALAGPTDPHILHYTPTLQTPTIELPEVGVNNVPLTSLWNPHMLDYDPLHGCWLRGSAETDESGAGSCASYNHPSDALNIELPQEVETLVSSSEFFQTSHLVGHEESLEQPDDLTSSTLEREGEERCDWEMDFSSQDCRGTSTGTSTNILNFFLGQPCSESQSLFLFNQDCGRDTSSSPFPSSSSVESESTHSNISIHDPIFDTMESPSMAELCEMLGDSQNVGHNDFAHMTLTEDEQQQLLGAAKIIQNAFRKYRSRRQMRAREKRAALLIERYYKRYKEIKRRHEQSNRGV